MKMNFNFKPIRIVFAVSILGIVCFGTASAHSFDSERATSKHTKGILLLAHGGKQFWNDEVKKLAAVVDKQIPVEVAFGMASKRSIQSAIERLEARGVKDIYAVPLFISSNSSVITSTEYLLALRAEAPKDLAMFARMSHGHGGGEQTSHGNGHGSDFDPTTPISNKAKIRMLPALNAHPLVADILYSRATALSSAPEIEVVVIVAHGPVSDETNKLWLADMGKLAGQVEKRSKFKRIEYLTVRDDAPAPVRDAATAELRAIVSRATTDGSNVLVVPLLLSYGGIEEGIKKRLEGLSYSMSSQALLPDERLIEWVLLSVKEAK